MADALSRENGDLNDIHRKNTNGEYLGGEYDVESQLMGKSLTRADTAAWVTKHPSRIPDDGIFLYFTSILYLAMRKKELTYIVEFTGPDDPLNPLNWTVRKRVWATILLSFTTFAVTFASSVFSSGLRVVAAEFDISLEVATLGTSLFVLGFAVGPLVRPPFLLGHF